MHFNITFRNFDASDALKNYAREKVERVNKYLDSAGDAHVVLTLERHLHQADITIHSTPFVLRGRDKSEDMYASLDLAMDKIERQLRRYKDRLKHHHGRNHVHHGHDHLRDLTVRHNVLEVPPNAIAHEHNGGQRGPWNEDLAGEPRLIRTNEFLARSMSVSDAVMQMDLMGNEFFVFTNAQTQDMNVVYRRKDGHYGWIEASAGPAQAH